MPRPPAPVESFGPILMAALMRGAVDGVSISMPYREAVKFRQRLYRLRHAMRSEKHPNYELVSRVQVRVIWPPDTPVRHSTKGVPIPVDREVLCLVKIAPYDDEFEEALRRSGVSIDFNSVGTAISTSVPTLDDLLRDLEKSPTEAEKSS